MPLKHASVSRAHAELVVAGDGALYLTDCRSTGGTFVLRDGAWSAITQAHVHASDRVRLGKHETTVGTLLNLALAGDREAASPGDSAPADSRPAGPVRRDPLTGDILVQEDR